MAANPPIQHPIVDNNGKVTQPWIKWFTSVISEIDGGGP